MRSLMLTTAIAALAAGTGLLAASVSGAPAPKLKVGFIYVGPVGDFGWTYQHEAARQVLMKELGDKIETVFLENVNEGPDSDRAIEQLVRAGSKLVFTTSFGFMDSTIKVAKKYPD